MHVKIFFVQKWQNYCDHNLNEFARGRHFQANLSKAILFFVVPYKVQSHIKWYLNHLALLCYFCIFALKKVTLSQASL